MSVIQECIGCGLSLPPPFDDPASQAGELRFVDPLSRFTSRLGRTFHFLSSWPSASGQLTKAGS
jgi:hypothetical protein